MRSITQSLVFAVVLGSIATAQFPNGPTISPPPTAFPIFTVAFQPPPLTIIEFNKSIEEINHSMAILGSNFSQFKPWSFTAAQYTPLVRFPKVGGGTVDAAFTVVNDGRIDIPNIPPTATHGPVTLVYYKVPMFLFGPGTPSYPVWATSPTNFAIGVGVKFENLNANQSINSLVVRQGQFTVDVIGPTQPNLADRTLQPYNQAGSISRRVLLRAGESAVVDYRLLNGNLTTTMSFGPFPGQTRWTVGVGNNASVSVTQN